jgi:hypothetical protein
MVSFFISHSLLADKGRVQMKPLCYSSKRRALKVADKETIAKNIFMRIDKLLLKLGFDES